MYIYVADNVQKRVMYILEIFKQPEFKYPDFKSIVGIPISVPNYQQLIKKNNLYKYTFNK